MVLSAGDQLSGEEKTTMNTRAAEIVTALMEALEAKEFDKAATYLSDDFQFTGSTPSPLNKDQFIRLSSELAEGMPNLSYHFHDLQEVEEQLGEGIMERATIQITGTQVNSFELVPLSLPTIPETGLSVSLPEAHWEYLVTGEAITTIDVERLPVGWVSAMLHQLA